MTAISAEARHRALPSPIAATRLVAARVVAVLLTAAVAAVLVFRMTGGTWFVVETPSMGTAAPVGTLLIEQPVTRSAIHVGDIITFRPPTEPQKTYSHRVVAVTAEGFRTKGDINGAADGWTVPPKNVLGRTAAILPIAGWGVRALPILVAGFLLTLLLSRRWLPGPRRAVVLVVGFSLSLALAAACLHPFADMVLLQTSAEGRRAVARVVSTGVLPIRVTASGGESVHLAPGEVGAVPIEKVVSGQRIEIASALDLPIWGWGLLVLAYLAPLLFSATILASTRRRYAEYG